MKLSLLMFGEVSRVERDLAYLARESSRLLDKALQRESRHLANELSKEINAGGRPSFQKTSPLTRAIRRASGISGYAPAKATRQVRNAIASTRLQALEWYAGILKGKQHISPSGYVQDIARAALYLETGRKAFTLHLDRKSSRTGKTPRQWLWWMHMRGVLRHPPGKSVTAMQIREAPKRPFVTNVWEAENKNEMIKHRVMKDFLNIAAKTLNIGRIAF